jgi:HD-like signal output (HDOD) protein
VRLASLVANPDCHLEEVTELIAFDEALTLKLLRAANSAANGTSVRVGNVKEAVSRIGTAQVLALLVAAGARKILQAAVPEYGLDEGDLWRHSVAAAVAVEAMQAFITVDMPPETFTSALLHDVGKLVMARFLHPDIQALIQKAQKVDHLDQLEAESLLLEVNHAELGGLIAQHWNLPARVVQGIIYHNNPEQGHDVICDLTYLANRVAKRIEAGLDGRRCNLAILPEVTERLCLTPRKLEELSPVATSRYLQVRQRYNAM